MRGCAVFQFYFRIILRDTWTECFHDNLDFVDFGSIRSSWKFSVPYRLLCLASPLETITYPLMALQPGNQDQKRKSNRHRLRPYYLPWISPCSAEVERTNTFLQDSQQNPYITSLKEDAELKNIMQWILQIIWPLLVRWMPLFDTSMPGVRYSQSRF